MNILEKIVTAIRGGAREVGEVIVDSNATRIYGQEIEDAKSHLANAKENLAKVMAKEMQVKREIDRLTTEIEKSENNAVAALNAGKEDLAGDVAEKIVELENELAIQKQAQSAYADHVTRLKDIVKKTETKIREHERELAMVKTTDSVQKATRSINEHVYGGGSQLVNARESLERIKSRQQSEEDEMRAAEQLEGELGAESLEVKLREAGIGEGVDHRNAVLARIKNKAGK